MFDDYLHERLPSEPARLDLELPQSELDLTIDFNSILSEGKQEVEEYVVPFDSPSSPSMCSQCA